MINLETNHLPYNNDKAELEESQNLLNNLEVGDEIENKEFNTDIERDDRD